MAEAPSLPVAVFSPTKGSLSCNIFGWAPRWLQVFNDLRAFMVCFFCLSIFRGITISYFASMVPSMEKRFGLSSQSIGTVNAMSDVSGLLSAVLVAHFGGGHRPRWIAGSSLLVGIGYLLMAAPEIIFPPNPTSILASVMATSSDENEPFCDANRNESSQTAGLVCGEETTDGRGGPLLVLGLGQFVFGLGAMTAPILGMPFLDDNVKRRNAPLYFALAFVGLNFGPLVGTGLSAAFNAIYFDLSKPDFQPSDPRWISAWYLGFAVAGVGSIVMAVIMSCFPSALTKKPRRKPSLNGNGLTVQKDLSGRERKTHLAERTAVVPQTITVKDLPVNLRRLSRNSTYLMKVLGQILSAFALSGYISFNVKFMKEQYRVPQSTISIAGVLPMVLGMMIGVGLGSMFVRHFKLSPRRIGYVMAACSFLGATCFFSVTGLGCSQDHIIGVDDVAEPYNTTSADVCMRKNDCKCQNAHFNPVCDTGRGRTYVSACAAGCSSSNRRNGTKYYLDCVCAIGDVGSLFGELENTTWVTADVLATSVVLSGVCPKQCSNFPIYVALMSLAMVCMGFPTAGAVMLQFRIVDKDLKSLVNGLSTFAMSALGMLPAPILLGWLIDSSCRFWQTDSCGTRGACWIYNADEFRWKFHAIVGAVRLINCLTDLTVTYKVRHLAFRA
ncbi:Solute carrier organic anion transporter family member 5A1 [Hypsibius exemplaris]|uniref:Solute carrier organic anion transporter family member n=1 Tax=Hypsibius exemplaris TaxID=2072580 RepID=A0A9X6NKM4_HYPEX|nr:Solute carrier organic anion transporter family member 5A1 [Hypsibius exemplaris]